MGDSPFAKSSYIFAGKTVRAIVEPGQTRNIDLKIIGAAGRKLNGGILYADGAAFDDEVTFQIVDVDNILGYFPGIVLDEFLTWSIVPGNQMDLDLKYGADLQEGFYIRAVYKSTGIVPVKVAVNYRLHRGI